MIRLVQRMLLLEFKLAKGIGYNPSILEEEIVMKY
jgi:hypothetical protein